MPPRSRSWTVALIVAFHAAALPRPVHAGCNLIPPTELSYPSTIGGVASAITIPGRTVEIRLGPCDASPGFDPVAANNAVILTFVPPAGVPTAVPVTSGVTVANCTAGNCGLLSFVVPDTTAVLPPNGLAGPAEIMVVRGAATAADIGPLFEPRPSATACSNELEPIFQQFTVLPVPNDFAALASGAATQLLGTLDGGGDLLIPFNYLSVLPIGPGEPVARLVSAFATLDAFSSNPGVPIVVPDTSFARSFTVDGRPLPPLLRATSDGAALFGTTDAAQAIIRVARTDGADGPPIFDLSDRLSNGGRGPIVMTSFSAESGPPVPLANLHSSTTGVAYTRDESLEGNLNGASGDTDTNDRIVQIIDAATGMSSSTGMAAANPLSPIVGPAALATAGGTVAFFESEADQNGTDLNGDGDALDSVLRVFDLAGTERTPGGGLVGALRPSVNRQPLAVSGPLVFYREPAPGVCSWLRRTPPCPTRAPRTASR